MKEENVRDMMVPLEEYATVLEDATLCEAVRALEKAQEAFKSARYRHRAILVYDLEGKMIGKLSQMDIIKALEPDYTTSLHQADLSRFGITDGYLEEIVEQYDFWNQPLTDLCKAAGGRKVSEVMYTPTGGEYIRADASLQEATHRLVIGHHHSLLVTEGEEIVGVLRLSDLFDSVCRTMKKVHE